MSRSCIHLNHHHASTNPNPRIYCYLLYLIQAYHHSRSSLVWFLLFSHNRMFFFQVHRLSTPNIYLETLHLASMNIPPGLNGRSQCSATKSNSSNSGVFSGWFLRNCTENSGETRVKFTQGWMICIGWSNRSFLLPSAAMLLMVQKFGQPASSYSTLFFYRVAWGFLNHEQHQHDFFYTPFEPQKSWFFLGDKASFSKGCFFLKVPSEFSREYMIILHPTVIFEKEFSTWALLILIMKLRASRNTAGQPNVSWHLHGVQCYAFEAPWGLTELPVAFEKSPIWWVIAEKRWMWHLNGGYLHSCFYCFPYVFKHTYINESICWRGVFPSYRPQNHISPKKSLITSRKKSTPLESEEKRPEKASDLMDRQGEEPEGYCNTTLMELAMEADETWDLSHPPVFGYELCPDDPWSTFPLKRNVHGCPRQLRMYLGQTICFGNIIHLIWHFFSFDHLLTPKIEIRSNEPSEICPISWTCFIHVQPWPSPSRKTSQPFHAKRLAGYDQRLVADWSCWTAPWIVGMPSTERLLFANFG